MCPWERKLTYFLFLSFFEILSKGSCTLYRNSWLNVLLRNILIVSLILVLVLQTGQVHDNLQKPWPVPGPLYTQQPLANRPWRVLESKHEKVRPAAGTIFYNFLIVSSQNKEMISIRYSNRAGKPHNFLLPQEGGPQRANYTDPQQKQHWTPSHSLKAAY